MRLVTGAHAASVRALIESLPYDTLVRDNPVQRAIADGALSYSAALQCSLDPIEKRMLPSPHQLDRVKFRAELRGESVVCARYSALFCRWERMPHGWLATISAGSRDCSGHSSIAASMPRDPAPWMCAFHGSICSPSPFNQSTARPGAASTS